MKTYLGRGAATAIDLFIHALCNAGDAVEALVSNDAAGVKTCQPGPGGTVALAVDGIGGVGAGQLGTSSRSEYHFPAYSRGLRTWEISL